MVLDINQSETPEQRAERINQEAANLRAEVEAAKEQKRRERKRQQENDALIAKVQREELERQAKARVDAELYGFTDEQKKWYNRALEITHSLDYSNLSDAQKEDLLAEQEVLIKKICELGRNQGDLWFRAVTVYVNGNQMIIPDPHTGKLGYREGNFILGAQTTDKVLETDEAGTPKFVTLPTVIAKTQIPITSKWRIRIIGKDQPTEEDLKQRPKPKTNQIFPKGYVSPDQPQQPQPTIAQAVEPKKEISKVSKFLRGQ